MNKETKSDDKEIKVDLSSEVNGSFRLAIAKKTGFRKKPFLWTKQTGKIIRMDVRNPTRH